ncbi:MAG TPA: 50S ribosomal protein L25 [Candidatus Absconditabacterales bacterium]|nr:50S ribosomal protein L25 [Candidatus Absconditabacterales bacterium]
MKLNVEVRDIKGKEVKKLRKEGKIPAVIYGKHMDNALSIICDKNEFVKLYRKTGSSTPIVLKGNDIDQMVLVYDYQLDPVMDEVLHVDFLAIKKGEKVTAEVDIVMTGEELSPIVKSGDANIQLIKDFIEIEALPKDLPKEIIVDVSSVDDMNFVLSIKDLELPEGVEAKEDVDITVITVMELKDIPEEEEPTVDAAGTPIEGAEGSEGGEDKEIGEGDSNEKKEDDNNQGGE